MILMPETLTAENGAKAALIGEFHETFTHECSECGGDGLGYASPHTQGETPCDLCNGTGELVERIPVGWTTIKEFYKRAVALLGQPQNDAIAEAVAAEREKNAKACEAQRLNEISAPADWHNDACKACARAIRSAAK